MHTSQFTKQPWAELLQFHLTHQMNYSITFAAFPKLSEHTDGCHSRTRKLYMVAQLNALGFFPPKLILHHHMVAQLQVHAMV